jgi:predicted ribosomally synthesized peptide with SipW-like signal peptide
MLVVGALCAAMSGTTFASFTAQTTNSGSITTGTLLLGDKVGSGSLCFSSGTTIQGSTGTNNTAACDQLFSAFAKPGDSGSVAVTITNEGNLNASALTVSAAGACSESGANYVSNATTFNGAATDLCAKAQLSVDEDGTYIYGTSPNDATHTWAGFATTFSGTPLNTGALNSGSSHVFTFHWALPSTLGNEYQARVANMTVVFHLDQ